MILRESFDGLKDKVFGWLKPGEHLFLNLSAESSQFVRINGAKVRQAGTIDNAELEFSLVLEKDGVLRQGSRSCTLTGLSWKDPETAERTLKALREEVAQLPADPYAELPRDTGSSELNTPGKLLDADQAVDALLPPATGLDIAGIYAAGSSIRAMANSAGQRHWFFTDTFSLDYSLYTPSQRAMKGTLAGQTWDADAYKRALDESRRRLALLEKPARKIERGEYRVYLAPAAVADLVNMFSWGAVSEASLRQGDSPLRLVRSGERKLSPKFSLMEDFRTGGVPRFNSEGELAPEVLPLIEAGQLKSTLVSTRSAREYGVAANGAEGDETLRAPAVAAGTLRESEILKALGTGLYLSNLHYLNWSDQAGGRITGMTRYACFWVENGQIVQPIETMRWDDDIFRLFGSSLEELTVDRSYEPEVQTYEWRQLGGTLVPGALLSKMAFTL